MNSQSLQVKDHDVHYTGDLPAFWARRPKLAERILPYMWWPCTSAAIERSFSLAGTFNLHDITFMHFFASGLIDAKNRQKASETFKAAAVGLYCNGDVEGRFTQAF